MLDCGHKEDFRNMITSRAVVKYNNSLKNHNSGTKMMYRTRKEMTKQWAEEGGKPTKSDWLRKSGATSVFNVPAIKNSELALAVQEVLDTVPRHTGGKAKVQEKPGTSVRASLVRANPFTRESCGRGSRCP